jgi:hypothetical protein
MLKQFSVYINPDYSEKKHDHPSHIAFGWNNLSMIGKNAVWNFIPILPREDFWTLRIKSFEMWNNINMNKIKNHLLQVCDILSDCRAIVDTGSSYLGIPAMFYDTVLTVLTKVRNCKCNFIFTINFFITIHITFIYIYF